MKEPPDRPPLLKMLASEDFESCASRLKALADADRLQIINCLLCGPRNVSQLAAELGADLVKISHHLGVLRHAGIVTTERCGKYVIYRLDEQVTLEVAGGDAKTINLGCCRLDLPKPDDGQTPPGDYSPPR